MRPILHHYPNSPFAEKIRTLLGFKRIDWTSVLIPAVMPKPDVIALTGGYRKTPILQLGADIYCDTSLIAALLEDMAPEPSVHPAESKGLAPLIAQWADATLFWTAIPYTMQPAGIAHIFADLPREAQQAFGVERAAFRGNAHRMRIPESTQALLLYLDEFETLFGDQRQWLLGDLASIADFSVYHCLWYVSRGGPVAGVLDSYPLVSGWLRRMKSIGHGSFDRLASQDAIALAAQSKALPTEPDLFMDTHGLAFGTQVSITPTDYGLDPVVGAFVISRKNEIGVRRTDERAGTVVVHFPRLGFEVRRVETA